MKQLGGHRGALLGGIALAALVLSGCSGPRLAVGMMTPVLENTVDVALRTEDPELIREALPTSLLLVEGMLETSPDNSDAAELGALLSFAYAFAFLEQEDPDRAVHHYARGQEFAWRAFGDEERERAIREGTFDELAEAIATLDEDDVDAALWACANWGMWIWLNVDDPRAAADLARVTPLAERVAELDETLFWGMPRILLGAIYASRPVMLGGDLDGARREFDRAFELSDRNMLLAQVFFARTWCIQAFSEESYQAYVSSLREVLDAPPGLLPEAEFLNRIARIQAEPLLAEAEEIFE